MEVDGKEFLRNVGIEQDKERLIQEQQKLEQLKRASIKREQSYANAQVDDDESAFVDLSMGSDSPSKETDNDSENIILDNNANADNKKKYIILGLGLVILFIITVLVIRLISNNDMEEQLNEATKTKTEIVKEDILNKIDSNDEYQKIIDKKLELEESKRIAKKEKEDINEIIIPEEKIDNVPLVINTPKPKIKEQRDLFELDNTTSKVVDKVSSNVNNKKQIVKEESKKISVSKVFNKPKREIIIPPANEKNFTKNSTSLTGYYVQIGAFTKEPNRNLLRDISKKGYNYTVHKLTIKGKNYNKVLIGSYKSRSDATKQLSQIKIDFQNPNAYILKF